MNTKRQRKLLRTIRRRIRAELRKIDAGGQPSDWLLAQCMKKHRHQLRARVMPGAAELLR